MTACVQTLPSLVIPSSPRVPKFYCKKPTSVVQDTKEDFRVTIKHFQKKFPALTTLYAENCNARQVTDHSNLWSYGTPYLVKLLFTGNLPKSFFEEICKAYETAKCKHQNKFSEQKGSERQIWLPRDKIKIRESGRRVEQRILEARLRHKENLECVSLQTEKRRNRTEVIRLKKAGEMARGKRACLDKMQRQHLRPGLLIKRQCDSPLTFNSANSNAFIH